jgi:hypothetical protein
MRKEIYWTRLLRGSETATEGIRKHIGETVPFIDSNKPFHKDNFEVDMNDISFEEYKENPLDYEVINKKLQKKNA